jgi:hypothetical protein
MIVRRVHAVDAHECIVDTPLKITQNGVFIVVRQCFDVDAIQLSQASF